MSVFAPPGKQEEMVCSSSHCTDLTLFTICLPALSSTFSLSFLTSYGAFYAPRSLGVLCDTCCILCVVYQSSRADSSQTAR